MSYVLSRKDMSRYLNSSLQNLKVVLIRDKELFACPLIVSVESFRYWVQKVPVDFLLEFSISPRKHKENYNSCSIWEPCRFHVFLQFWIVRVCMDISFCMERYIADLWAGWASPNLLPFRPAIHLPGPSKPVVAVRFCPVIFSLQPNMPEEEAGCPGKNLFVSLTFESLVWALAVSSSAALNLTSAIGSTYSSGEMQVHLLVLTYIFCVAGYPGFRLPYRLVFALATLDSLFIYDTQHSNPIVIFAGLHYAAITDIAWSLSQTTCLIGSLQKFSYLRPISSIYAQFLPTMYLSIICLLMGLGVDHACYVSTIWPGPSGLLQSPEILVSLLCL